MNDIEIMNAVITKTHLGLENHGIFSYMLSLDLSGGGSIGWGGYALDDFDKELKRRIGTAPGMELIMQIMAVVNVEKWEDLRGKHIRVKQAGGWGGKLIAIGHFMEDKWLNLEDFFAEQAVSS